MHGNLCNPKGCFSLRRLKFSINPNQSSKFQLLQKSYLPLFNKKRKRTCLLLLLLNCQWDLRGEGRNPLTPIPFKTGLRG